MKYTRVSRVVACVYVNCVCWSLFFFGRKMKQEVKIKNEDEEKWQNETRKLLFIFGNFGSALPCRFGIATFVCVCVRMWFVGTHRHSERFVNAQNETN